MTTLRSAFLFAVLIVTAFVPVGMSVTAQEATCPGAPAPRLAVGGQGEVTLGSANNVRAEPNTSASIVFRMEAGTAFSVASGPVCGEGYAWWQVAVGSQSGWTVEGTGETYFLAPIAADATPPPVTPDPAATCALPPRLVINETARVITGTPSRLRDTAGVNGAQIGQLNPVDTIRVEDGPVCQDGFNWWQVSVGNLRGWTAEGINGEYFLEPIVPTPTPRPPFIPLPSAYLLDWSPDGMWIAVGTGEGLFVFDTSDWTAPPRQILPEFRILGLAFDPQQPTRLAVSYFVPDPEIDRSRLELIDVETGESLTVLEELFVTQGQFRDLAFSQDGRFLAGRRGGSFAAVELERGAETYGVRPPDYSDEDLVFNGFSIVGFSPDGAWLAGAYPTGHSSVVFAGAYGATEGELIGIESVTIEEAINDIAFSPEGNRFVTGGDNGNLRMWSLPDFEYRSFIRGERSTTSNRVNDIAFSPAEPILATAESDPVGVVRLFDSLTLRQLQATTLSDRESVARKLVFSPSGMQIAVLFDNTVVILDRQTLELVERLVRERNE